MELLKKQRIIIISIQKELESEAWSLNAPEILLDTKYKLSLLSKIYKIKLIIRWRTI